MHGPVGERLVIDEGAAEEAFAFFGHVFEAEHPVTFDQAQGAAEEVEAVMAGGQAERKGLGEIFVVLEGAVFDEGRGGGGMKLAFVTPRYGTEVIGGAETAARMLAERLCVRPGWEVEVLTSCALDHLTWENHNFHEVVRRGLLWCAGRL